MPVNLKPGNKTSEFILTALGATATFGPAAYSLLQNNAAAAAIFAAVGATIIVVYSLGRALLKLEEAKRTDFLDEDTEMFFLDILDKLENIRVTLPKKSVDVVEGVEVQD